MSGPSVASSSAPRPRCRDCSCGGPTLPVAVRDAWASEQVLELCISCHLARLVVDRVRSHVRNPEESAAVARALAEALNTLRRIDGDVLAENA